MAGKWGLICIIIFMHNAYLYILAFFEGKRWEDVTRDFIFILSITYILIS